MTRSVSAIAMLVAAAVVALVVCCRVWGRLRRGSVTVAKGLRKDRQQE